MSCLSRFAIGHQLLKLLLGPDVKVPIIAHFSFQVNTNDKVTLL